MLWKISDLKLKNIETRMVCIQLHQDAMCIPLLKINKQNYEKYEETDKITKR